MAASAATATIEERMFRDVHAVGKHMNVADRFRQDTVHVEGHDRDAIDQRAFDQRGEDAPEAAPGGAGIPWDARALRGRQCEA